MTAAALPPRPNSMGEPAPPRAPAVVGAWAGFPERNRDTVSHRPGLDQRWFARAEPILEVVQARRRNALWFAARYPLISGLMLAVLVTAYLLIDAARTDGFAWAEEIRVWAVIIAVLTAGYTEIRYLQHRKQLVYAGVDWVGEGSGRGECVGTYELSRIALTDGTLHLTGRDGTRLDLPMGLLEANPALWDLVYNGLRHSTAAGAETDPTTRERLRLT